MDVFSDRLDEANTTSIVLFAIVIHFVPPLLDNAKFPRDLCVT